jgi:hypothetical protein
MGATHLEFLHRWSAEHERYRETRTRAIKPFHIRAAPRKESARIVVFLESSLFTFHHFFDTISRPGQQDDCPKNSIIRKSGRTFLFWTSFGARRCLGRQDVQNSTSSTQARSKLKIDEIRTFSWGGKSEHPLCSNAYRRKGVANSNRA